MKISVKKEELLNSLNIVNKGIKKGGTTLPILECVLIDASKDDITLITYDGKEITVKRKTNGNILEKGKAAIYGARLIDMVRNVPEGKDVEIEVNDKKEGRISCGSDIEWTIPTQDELTYPNIKEEKKENMVIINEYKLKKIIDKTSFAYDKNMKIDKQILKGINVKVEANRIQAKSMNGYTISIINESLIKDFGNYETIIPGNSLEELNSLIKGEVDKDVKIYFSSNDVSFEFNNTIFNTSIINDKYINTDRLIKIEYTTKVNINRTEFIESLNRATVVTDDRDKKPVIFDIKEDKMYITLSSMHGEFKTNIPNKKTGKDLIIAFNPNSLLNILNAISDENISLYFSGPKQPIIIKDVQENYFYLLVAVNI